LKVFVSLLIAACCLLVLPSAAMAVQYTVDSTLDEPDANPGTGGCLTAGGKCTLRAAIQESNASALVVDEIHFDVAFNGQLADTITLGSLLPPIANPVEINAGSCTTQAGQSGPCAGIEASALSYGLSVEDTNTVGIAGLAITGATTGIRVVNSSKSFVARNNWLGLKLDGSNGSGANTGIWLDPESDNATIGGTTAGQGNVFVNNAAEGLDIEGADNADVLGNYFGVKADGVTKAANGKNIEITDTAAIAATGNEVGTTISGAAAPCDGGCNVISGATTAGVDLIGNGGNEKPATGPTTIHGNYMGLSAAGTTVVANGEYGVFTGKAGEVTVGGPANGDANFFAGLGTGIFYASGEGFKAMGNSFGNGPTGLDVTSPNTAIFVSTLENSLPVTILGNVIRMEGGVGIEARFGGTEIKNSFIEGAELGIWTKASPGAAGANLIEDNVIGESTANGIRIEDSANLVFGNSVYKSTAAGIRIQNPTGFELVNATENQIGGNSTDRENNIRESGGDAIEINNSGGEGASQNEVARNKGEENAGLFIDLIGSLTNGGILPPQIDGAKLDGANGSGAEAGANVRVFRKETAEAGEVESFLGEAIADSSGDWSVNYAAALPGETQIAATQTSLEGATSELAFAKTEPTPKTDGCQDALPAAICVKNPDEADAKPPETTILKGPKAKSKKRMAKFRFSSDEAGSTFQCKLDRKPVKRCGSPKKYKGLKVGKHVFRVWATDAAGNKDPTPAKKKFKILG
jgi:CSLREA domain-containing protein